MEFGAWIYFMLACFGLALTPGPNSLLVLTNSVAFGTKKTMYTIIGGVLSFMGLMAISMFGITSILSIFPSFLIYIKLLGGIYLIYLGIKQFRLNTVSFDLKNKSKKSANGISLFIHGAIIAGSNPKVFLFFGAFIPPFINPEKSFIEQFIIMAITFGTAEFIIEVLVNIAANKCRNLFNYAGKKFNMICGGIFILIGMLIIFESNSD